MTSPPVVDAVRHFLESNSDRAFLVSEVVAGVRPMERDEAEVLGAIKDLAERGEVVSRRFAVRDPHLAFDNLQFVAAVEPVGSRQAEINTQRAYQAWLRAWLSSHRCC